MSGRRPDAQVHSKDDPAVHKVFGFIPLMPGWTREEWLAHYQERHGPLVAATASFARHFTAYAQNYTLEGLEGGAPYVGVSELWTADAATLDAAFAEPDYQAAVRPDELLFTRQDEVCAGVGREVVIHDRPLAGDKRWALRPRYKLFVRHWPRPGVDADAFRDGWLRQARSGTDGGASDARIRRHVVTLPLAASADQPVAIEEYWFDEPDDGRSAWDRLRERSEGEGLAVTARSEALLARHHRVFGR